MARGISWSLWQLFYSPLFPSIFFLFSSHPLTTSQLLRRWKELHQNSLCSRAKSLSTTLSSPGYLKPPASLMPRSSDFVRFPHIIIHGLLSSTCLHQCLLSPIAGFSSLRGLCSLISFPLPHFTGSFNTQTVQQSCTMSTKHLFNTRLMFYLVK